MQVCLFIVLGASVRGRPFDTSVGRYTHRVAISNHRLLGFEQERVRFRWKDYAHGGKQSKMTLGATEFLRRFFLRVLPRGFVRIRHFGVRQSRVPYRTIARYASR